MNVLLHRVRVSVTDVIVPLLVSFGLGAAVNAPCEPPSPPPPPPPAVVNYP